MTKKLVIILSIFCLVVLTSGAVFATNITHDVENTLNGAKNGVQNMVQDTGKAIEGAKDGVGDMMNNAGKGMENMARGVGNVVEGTKNGIEDMLHEGTDDIKDMGRDTKTDVQGTETRGTDAYTAIRTTAADAINATNRTNNITTWVILAVACAIVALLVWYYGTQTNNKDNY